MLARLNRWSDVDKAAYSLRGPAVTVLTNLPPDQCQCYASLIAALQSRVGTAHQTELNRVKLKARTRRREETLAELAEDIEWLVRLAYPDPAESMVEVLAKDQFVDSHLEDNRLRIQQHRPAVLRAALETALELESYQLASKQKARFVKEIQFEKEQSVQSVTTSKGTVAPGDVLQQLMVALEQCCKTPTPSVARRERTPTALSNLVCWKCKQTGPQLQGSRPTQQQNNSRVSHPGKWEVAELAGLSSADTSTAPTNALKFKTGSFMVTVVVSLLQVLSTGSSVI